MTANPPRGLEDITDAVGAPGAAASPSLQGLGGSDFIPTPAETLAHLAGAVSAPTSRVS